MAIKYDKYELLEFFYSEPTVIDHMAEIFKYQVVDEHKFRLFLSFWTYDETCFVYLKYGESSHSLVDLEINNTKEIKADSNSLIIYQENKIIMEIYKNSLFFIKTVID